MQRIKITYRGWPGHFICAKDCVFRLNTLVGFGKCRIVVSTVGNLQPRESKGAIDQIGASRYYETMVFHAQQVPGSYWDINVEKEVKLNGKWTVDKISLHSDREAQEMHEAAVEEIVLRLKLGEFSG
jgi:hypothetical protein